MTFSFNKDFLNKLTRSLPVLSVPGFSSFKTRKYTSLGIAAVVTVGLTVGSQVNIPLLSDAAEMAEQKLLLAYAYTLPSQYEWAVDENQILDIKVKENTEKETASVLVNDREVMKFRSDYEEYTPGLRAKKAAYTLYEYIKRGGEAQHIFPKVEAETIKLMAGEHVLADIDAETAKRAKNPPKHLALVWSNLTRDALGAPKLISNVAGRYNKRKNNQDYIDPSQLGVTGQVLNGKASWYGPGFHGRTAADGSRYNMYAMTAAHKRLPFGTILRVTNVKNGKHVVVRITDRGPYVGDRIIDLSKGAAQELGMLGSGVARIRAEVLAKNALPVEMPHIDIPDFEETLLANASESIGPEPDAEVNQASDELTLENLQNIDLNIASQSITEKQPTISLLDGQLLTDKGRVANQAPEPDSVAKADDSKMGLPPEPSLDVVLDDVLKGEIILAPAVVEEQIKNSGPDTDFDQKIKPIIDAESPEPIEAESVQ